MPNPCTQSAPAMTLGSEVALRARGFGRLRAFPVGHAGKEVFRALLHFIFGELFLASGDAPGMSKRIGKGAVAVAPELVGDRHGFFSTGGDCLFEGGVHIGDIEIKSGRSSAEALWRLGIAWILHLVGEEDDGVANLQLGVTDFAVGHSHAR